MIKFQFLIDNGALVNATDKYGLTALHHASIRGNVTAVRKLLAADGISREPRDVQQSTPLHIASTYDHVDVAAILLREGADPRAVDEDRRTPLHEACLEGNEEIVRVLLQEGKERFGEDYARSVRISGVPCTCFIN